MSPDVKLDRRRILNRVSSGTVYTVFSSIFKSTPKSPYVRSALSLLPALFTLPLRFLLLIHIEERIASKCGFSAVVRESMDEKPQSGSAS